MRLIDVDALLKACEEAQKSDPLADNRGWSDHFLNSAGEPSAEWWAIEDMIESQPIINAAPVVHGRWAKNGCVKKPEYDPTTDYPSYAHRCSICDRVSYFPNNLPDAYCRRCGARMDGGD